MPLRFERSHQFQRIEPIITASVGPVQSGKHLEHNAQRQKAPAHSTRYSAITIEEIVFMVCTYVAGPLCVHISNGRIVLKAFISSQTPAYDSGITLLLPNVAPRKGI